MGEILHPLVYIAREQLLNIKQRNLLRSLLIMQALMICVIRCFSIINYVAEQMRIRCIIHTRKHLRGRKLQNYVYHTFKVIDYMTKLDSDRLVYQLSKDLRHYLFIF